MRFIDLRALRQILPLMISIGHALAQTGGTPAAAAATGPSEIIRATRSGPINPPPSGLALVSKSEWAIQLKFSCAGNADWHDVHRRADGDPLYKVLSVHPTCDDVHGIVLDSDVIPEHRFCYYIQALNSDHLANSNEVCVMTPPPSSVRPPTVWLTTPYSDRIIVTVRDNATNETRIRLFRQRVGSAWSEVHVFSRDGVDRGTGSELTFEDIGLSENTQYAYYAVAEYVGLTSVRSTSSPVVKAWTRKSVRPSSASACKSSSEGVCDATLQLSNLLPLTYYRNYNLSTPNPSIVRLVVAIHGLHRQPWSAFGVVVSSADAVGELGETLVVAPYFRYGQWNEEWDEGGISVPTASLPGISSFKAVDELLQSILGSGRFPNLREVVIAGHSAGGQFVHRYAATSKFEDTRPAVKFRYVVANPSSYMYLDNKRPNATGNFVVPTGCSGYDEYKYGLQNRSGYVALVSANEIRKQYPEREVYYLLGEKDTFDDGTMDTSCKADLQGANRFARGTYFYYQMLNLFPTNRHRRITIPDVGHDTWGMFGSTAGANALVF